MPAHNKKISKKREASMGKQIGGRAHIASGALWFQKGDLSNDLVIIEDKFTHKDFFSITTTILYKIEKEGKKEGKIPFVTVGFHTQKFSVGIINEKYLLSPPAEGIVHFVSKGKSFKLDFTTLRNSYLTDASSYLLKITIEGINYYIIEWETLIDKLDSFIAI